MLVEESLIFLILHIFFIRKAEDTEIEYFRATEDYFLIKISIILVLRYKHMLNIVLQVLCKICIPSEDLFKHFRTHQKIRRTLIYGNKLQFFLILFTFVHSQRALYINYKLKVFVLYEVYPELYNSLPPFPFSFVETDF